MAMLTTTRRDALLWVHDYLTVAAMVNCYDHVIHPIPDESTWSDIDHPKILHPLVKQKPGRLKKNRICDPTVEGPLKPKRSGRGHCSRCLKVGHNVRR